MPMPADKAALAALEDALSAVLRAAGDSPPSAVVKRIREGLAAHARLLESARAATDPISLPKGTFDPSDPKIVGRMVSIALMAQPIVPLSEVKPAYGSGVYAIYYHGSHPLYKRISGTETPIYIGKADPESHDASSPREQGARLTARLMEHAGTIETAENYARANKLPAGLHPIKIKDFSCRRVVCATNAQLVAENHLIRMFWPIWNSETKACWGMSKHGDAAKTRANKRSPWDVVHPGRAWALDAKLVDSLSPDAIRGKIKEVLDRVPPRADHAAILDEMLTAFRQEDKAVEDEQQTTPIGAGAPGPEDDEAGGADS
jgi:hypothetical protein